MVANLIKCIYNPIIFFFYRYYINIVYINPGLVTRNSKLTSNFDWASLFTLMAKYIVYHWHSTMVDVEEWLSEYLDKPLPHNYVCWPSSKRLQIPKKQWYSHAWQIILFSSKSHIWSNNVLTWSTHTHTHSVFGLLSLLYMFHQKWLTRYFFSNLSLQITTICSKNLLKKNYKLLFIYRVGLLFENKNTYAVCHNISFCG